MMNRKTSYCVVLLLGFLTWECAAQSFETRMQFQQPVQSPSQSRTAVVSSQPQTLHEMARLGLSPEKRTQPPFAAQPVMEPSKPPRVASPAPSFTPSYSVGTSVVSKYLRDGWCENPSPVALFQAEISESGLYVGVKSTYDFTDRVGRKEHFQDSRFYIGYSLAFANTGTLGPTAVDVCWTRNSYPGDSGRNSGSISMSLLLDEIWHRGIWTATGSATLEHNYGKNETFAVTDATLHCMLTESGSLLWENTVALFWGDTRKLRRLSDGDCGGNAFYALNLQSSVTWNFSENWSLTPFIEWNCHLDGRAREAAKVDDLSSASVLLGGLRLSAHF